MITTLIVGIISAVAGAVTAVAMARKARIEQEIRFGMFAGEMEKLHKRTVKAERAERKRNRDNQPKSRKSPN